MEIIDYSKFDATPLAMQRGWDGSQDLQEWCRECLAWFIQGIAGTSEASAQAFVRGLPNRLTRHGGLPDVKRAKDPMVATWAFAMTDHHAFRLAIMEHWALHTLANQPFEPPEPLVGKPKERNEEAA
jgi:hypothetical protein